MDFATGGILCIAILLLLLALGVQIGLAFILGGFVVSVFILGFDSSVSLLGLAAYFSVATPTWAAIPLFILMGAFASRGGLARRAYDGVHALSRRVPGSLMVATCFSCGMFGAVSGSSIATTAIFGKMALPEMHRLRYDKALSVGCIASAGTFASMIPPSMMMIIYALFTQQSIGRLFAAGIVPGLMTALAYALLIVVMVKRKPSLAPEADDAGRKRLHGENANKRCGCGRLSSSASWFSAAFTRAGSRRRKPLQPERWLRLGWAGLVAGRIYTRKPGDRFNERIGEYHRHVVPD